jgi:hypothetical protein
MSQFRCLSVIWLILIHAAAVPAWAWVKLNDSGDLSSFQEKAIISEKEWVLPALGSGKFSQNGGTFITKPLSHSALEPGSRKEPADMAYKISVVKQEKPIADHAFDYILSNDQAPFKVVYFAEKTNPNNKKVCALSQLKSETTTNLKEAMTSTCWALETKKFFLNLTPITSNILNGISNKLRANKKIPRVLILTTPSLR